MPRIRFSMQTFLSLIALIAALLAVWLNAPEEPPLRHTHRKLDVAIVGEGYLQVSNPDTGEQCYTRCGRLGIDEYNQLTIRGTHFSIQPAISVLTGEGDLHISKEGRVRILQENVGAVDIGQLQIALFTNVDGLEPVADNIFRATDESSHPIVSSPGEAGAGVIQQGWLESHYNLKELAVSYAPLALAGIAAMSLLLALTRRSERGA